MVFLHQFLKEPLGGGAFSVNTTVGKGFHLHNTVYDLLLCHFELFLCVNRMQAG